MNEHGDEPTQHPPRWVPYTPPAPDGWDRVRLFLRRLSFPFALLLLAGGVAGVFYWNVQMEEQAASSSPSVNVLPSTIALDDRSEALSSTQRTQLAVRSIPSGATVRVNGDSVGVTPFADSTQQAGVYMLSVQQKGYFRADTVVVLEGASAATVRFSLRQRPDYEGPSPTEAQSTPPTGPQSPPEAPSGSRPLPITSAPDSPERPAPTPVYGALYVTSVPNGAVVTMDGTERGRTPLPISKVSPGTKQLSVTLDGYRSWSSAVTVRADTTARVHADLQENTGRLRVLVRPWGTIYIDDALHVRESDVWYETSLPPGTHEIRAVHPVLGEQTQTATVRGGEETEIVLNLRPEENNASP